MHGIAIRVDFVLVIIWFSLCMCVCLDNVFFTGGVTSVAGFSLLAFFIF